MTPIISKRLSLLSTAISVAVAIGLAFLFNAREQDRQERVAAQKMMDEVNSKTVAQSNLINTILSETDLAIVTVDKDGSIVSWNDGAARKFGYTQDDLRGKTLDCLMTDPDLIDKHQRAFDERRVTEWVRRGIAMDCTIPTKSGAKKHVLVFAYEVDRPPAKFAAIIHTPKFVVKQGG